ncbi:MAG: D-2-hydroxyacid dehydrogenase [Clostridiaceae bacterium]|nr:D-2-hydroxyacid dehydrogenase [Clostridiaceae bacterium]
MKIVVLDGYTENPGDLSWGGLAALGQLTVYDRTPADQIISRIGQAEIVLTNKTPLREEIFAACPDIRYIGVLATGYNIVDVPAAERRGITVTNIPAYGTAAVAQFTFALLLEVCHHAGHHADEVRRGRWSASPDFCFWDYPLIELAGKTLGLVGFGRIGRDVSRIAAAFHLNILVCTRHPLPDESCPVEFVDMKTLYARSDIISLHCPLFPETQGLVNRNSIALMKDGVILINTARGQLVVEQDLRLALDSGKVAAYAADVLSAEPADPSNPLLQAKNCLLTPHIAWASRESRQRLMNTAVDNLAQFLKGTPVNRVAPSV